MLAICSQEIVSIPHIAKLGPVQAQLPQSRHAFGLPGQMHAITAILCRRTATGGYILLLLPFRLVQRILHLAELVAVDGA